VEKMNESNKAKMTRYLRNADRFMWGILPGGKREVFTALRKILTELGEDASLMPDDYRKATYATVADKLLDKLGIERILTDIVVKQVNKRLTNRVGDLEFLRAHWMSGTLPRWQTLQSLRAPRSAKQVLTEVFVLDDKRKPVPTWDIVDSFVEVNSQYNYVHGWTVFAGLWFDEIEPLAR